MMLRLGRARFKPQRAPQAALKLAAVGVVTTLPRRASPTVLHVCSESTPRIQAGKCGRRLLSASITCGRGRETSGARPHAPARAMPSVPTQLGSSSSAFRSWEGWARLEGVGRSADPYQQARSQGSGSPLFRLQRPTALVAATLLHPMALFPLVLLCDAATLPTRRSSTCNQGVRG